MAKNPLDFPSITPKKGSRGFLQGNSTNTFRPLTGPQRKTLAPRILNPSNGTILPASTLDSLMLAVFEQKVLWQQGSLRRIDIYCAAE